MKNIKTMTIVTLTTFSLTACSGLMNIDEKCLYTDLAHKQNFDYETSSSINDVKNTIELKMGCKINWFDE